MSIFYNPFKAVVRQRKARFLKNIYQWTFDYIILISDHAFLLSKILFLRGKTIAFVKYRYSNSFPLATCTRDENVSVLNGLKTNDIMHVFISEHVIRTVGHWYLLYGFYLKVFNWIEI